MGMASPLTGEADSLLTKQQRLFNFCPPVPVHPTVLYVLSSHYTQAKAKKTQRNDTVKTHLIEV